MSLHVHGHHFATAGGNQLTFNPETVSSETKKAIEKRIKEIQEEWRKAAHLHKKANALKRKEDPNLKDAIELLIKKAKTVQAIADKKWELFRKAIEKNATLDTSLDETQSTDSESLSQSSSTSLSSSSESPFIKMIVIKRLPRTQAKNKSKTENLSTRSLAISQSLKNSNCNSPVAHNLISSYDPHTFLPLDLMPSSPSMSDKEKTHFLELYRSQKMKLSKLEKMQRRSETEEQDLINLQKLLTIQKSTLRECGIPLTEL